MKTFCAKMVSVSWFGEPGLHLDVARKRKTRFLAQQTERVMLLLVILIITIIILIQQQRGERDLINGVHINKKENH